MTASLRHIALRALCVPCRQNGRRSLISTLAHHNTATPHSPNSVSISHSPFLSLPSLPSLSSRPTHRSFATPTTTTTTKRPIPTLNATLRRFYFLVHPDLFHSHPHHRAINETNMQHFLGFITAIRRTDNDQPWPAAQHTNLTFYIRRRVGDGINTALSFIEYNERTNKKHNHHSTNNNNKTKRKPTQLPSNTEGEFHVLQLTLSTNGGNCRGIVEKQLRHLFVMLGLPEEFRWDDEYWQLKPPVKRGGGENEVQEDEYEYA